MLWKIANQIIEINRPLVCGILNVTPDSFSDGYNTLEKAIRRAVEMREQGADIIDIGGESTRPHAQIVSEREELNRVLPVIENLAAQTGFIISVDTTKPEVARRCLQAGASIINDISGLRFAPDIADAVAEHEAGLVLMHSIGTPETLHTCAPVADVVDDVKRDWRRAINLATGRGVKPQQIALDVGIGFGKTFAQNLELLARLDELASEFSDFPLFIGASRKRFIGKTLNDAPTDKRLYGTLAANVIAATKGAKILRVHDVRATVEAMRVVDEIEKQRSEVRGQMSEVTD